MPKNQPANSLVPRKLGVIMRQRLSNGSSCTVQTVDCECNPLIAYLLSPARGTNRFYQCRGCGSIEMTNTKVQIAVAERSSVISESDLADRRVEIQRDDRLRLTLKEWEGALNQVHGTLRDKQTNCTNAKTELYQLSAFYIIFQGAVLTAVFTASLLKCRTSWGPASLSLIASIAVVPSIHNRLKEYYVLKHNLFWDTEHSKVLREKIRMLQQRGTSFDFAELGGAKEETSSLQRQQQFETLSRKCHIVRWLTTLLLCVVSSVMLSCCYIIPCWEVINKT